MTKPPASGAPEYYVGLMSGTSLDGIDAAVASFQTGTPPLVAGHYRAFTPELRAGLSRLSLAAEVPLQALGEADADLGELFADCALAAIADAGLRPEQIRAIGSHGVTVQHAPDSRAPFTLQLGDANRIAEITGIATVADFRRRDIAAGGQGAPLAPAFHRAVFASPEENRVVLNIGGIANITVLPQDPSQPVSGFDTGPGNTLLDYWAHQHLGTPVDKDGAWGMSGHCRPALLDRLLGDGYFQRAPPKSTGKERFSPAWLEAHLHALDTQPEPADVQATLAHLTAASIALAVRYYAPATECILVCGGGVHNRQLLELLEAWLNCPEELPAVQRTQIRPDGAPSCTVQSTGAHGLDPDWIEAVAFAWLARQTLLGLPGNLPEATGARHAVVLGAIYPGLRSNTSNG